MFQGTLAAAQGGNFWQAAGIGLVSSGIAHGLSEAGALTQALGGATTGAFASKVTGGSFVEGFATGLTVAGLNHALHTIASNIQKNKSLRFYYDALEDLELNDGTILKKENLSISLDPDALANARYLGYKNNKHHINFDIGEYEITVDNVRATAIHEVFGHGVKGYRDVLNNHHKAYFDTIDSKYWKNTSPDFKKFTVKRMYEYFWNETGSINLPRTYLIEYHKNINNFNKWMKN